ncbi:MAG TPA: S1C family serine protease [Pseudolabrys sp.]|nr:S1C family serine protease [Pseudolabrys sp.]
MALTSEWKVPTAVQPKAEDYAYDLDRALLSVIGLRSIVSSDAFTAETLGTERAGNGVLIGNGLVLTIGYLITEAETVWLHLGDGRVAEGYALGFDGETGLGLVQALTALDLPALPMGRAANLQEGERVVVAGAGGRSRSVAARVVARQEFAGYWEYVLEDAIFTYPSHPNWGGTALIGPAGDLLGIGSLQLERARDVKTEHLNMIVPIDVAPPVIEGLTRYGRVDRPVRPWLGVYSTEIDDKLVVVGIAPKGPAARAELKTGDVLVAVDGKKVTTLAELYRRIWSLGSAGVEIPLTIYRDGVTFHVRVNSSDRARFLKTPRLH